MSTLGKDFLDPFFFAKARHAYEFDLDTIFPRELFCILTNLVAQRLGKPGVIEDPNVLRIQVRGHAIGWRCTPSASRLTARAIDSTLPTSAPKSAHPRKPGLRLLRTIPPPDVYLQISKPHAPTRLPLRGVRVFYGLRLAYRPTNVHSFA